METAAQAHVGYSSGRNCAGSGRVRANTSVADGVGVAKAPAAHAAPAPSRPTPAVHHAHRSTRRTPPRPPTRSLRHHPRWPTIERNGQNTRMTTTFADSARRRRPNSPRPLRYKPAPWRPRRFASEALVIGAGPGGYVAGIRLGQLEEGDGRRAGQARRRLPERGLHPVQGADQRLEALRQVRHGADIGIMADNLRVDMTKMQAVEGRGRQQADRRREAAAEGQRLRLPHRHRALTGPQHRRGRGPGRRRRQEDRHRGRPHRPRHRLAADRDPGLQVRRQAGGRLHRRAGLPRGARRAWSSSAAATSASRSARCTPSWAPRSRSSRRCPRILPGTDPELRQVVARKLKKLGVEVMTGAKAKWLEPRRATARSSPSRSAASEVAPSTPTSPGRRGPPAQLRGPGPGGGGREGRARLRPRRPPHAHQRRRHLRHRRRGRAADAGAQGVARGRGGRRGDRRPQAPRWTCAASPPSSSAIRRSRSAGITAEEAEKRGRKVKIGKFPFAALGRAIANADTDGFVKVVIDAGAPRRCWASTSSATAPRDVIAEAALAIEMGALADDLA